MKTDDTKDLVPAFDPFDVSWLAQKAAEAEAHEASCDPRSPCDRCRRYACPGCGTLGTAKGRCDGCITKQRRAARVEEWAAACDAEIPRRFRGWTWATEQGRTALAALVGVAAVKAAQEAVKARRPVILRGDPGSGKTSLGCAILRAWVAADGGPVYMPDTKLARAASSHPLGAGDAPEVTRSLRAGLLMLDDLGQDEGTYRSAIKLVLQERHDDDRPFVVTTFKTKAEIATSYGGGIARRLFGVDALELHLGRTMPLAVNR